MGREKGIHHDVTVSSRCCLAASRLGSNHATQVRLPPNKKPRPLQVGVSGLVETAGVEPASVSPLPLALHVYPIYCVNPSQPGGQDVSGRAWIALAVTHQACLAASWHI